MHKLALAVIAAGACLVQAQAIAQTPKPPNILVIMGDDTGVVQPQLRPASFNVDEVMRKLAPKD